jgi:hypothetical protein
MYKSISLAAAIAVAASFGPAHASSWPLSVVGTWDMLANQNSPVLTITSQGASGKCRPIGGTIVDTATGANDIIIGFYCPSSGRISFLRNNSRTNDTFQVFVGNLSDAPPSGHERRMGGTFLEETGTAAILGEYEWFAQQSPR